MSNTERSDLISRLRKKIAVYEEESFKPDLNNEQRTKIGNEIKLIQDLLQYIESIVVVQIIGETLTSGEDQLAAKEEEIAAKIQELQASVGPRTEQVSLEIEQQIAELSKDIIPPEDIFEMTATEREQASRRNAEISSNIQTLRNSVSQRIEAVQSEVTIATNKLTQLKTDFRKPLLLAVPYTRPNTLQANILQTCGQALEGITINGNPMISQDGTINEEGLNIVVNSYPYAEKLTECARVQGEISSFERIQATMEQTVQNLQGTQELRSVAIELSQAIKKLVGDRNVIEKSLKDNEEMKQQGGLKGLLKIGVMKPEEEMSLRVQVGNLNSEIMTKQEKKQQILLEIEQFDKSFKVPYFLFSSRAREQRYSDKDLISEIKDSYLFEFHHLLHDNGMYDLPEQGTNTKRIDEMIKVAEGIMERMKTNLSQEKKEQFAGLTEGLPDELKLIVQNGEAKGLSSIYEDDRRGTSISKISAVQILRHTAEVNRNNPETYRSILSDGEMSSKKQVIDDAVQKALSDASSQMIDIENSIVR